MLKKVDSSKYFSTFSFVSLKAQECFSENELMFIYKHLGASRVDWLCLGMWL